MSKFKDGVLAAVLFISLWYAFVRISGIPHFILPSPIAVAKTLFNSRELISYHMMITAAEVVIGLLIGSMLGAITAIHLTISPFARKTLLPFLVFSQAIPVFALAPILTLWLGYGLGSKIAMAVLIIYFPVTSTFFDGLNRTDKKLLDLATSMRATPSQTLWRIKIPAALPSFASGIKLAAVYAPIGAVIGEWVGASKGIGYLMLLANGRAKIDLMFAALIVLATFTVILHFIISHGAHKITLWSKGQS